ncbi:unnamed protein product [Effrenium voratum]|uniref:Uncharacterized protein n=1 Tax=Effrenium voratum TaxID=2562239 RepID=A0AA36I2I1_9DINO|nr:unnamed protein product [Effrenium voratum]CAJ1425068.1 unnamed protein product [Effrenium voratum]
MFSSACAAVEVDILPDGDLNGLAAGDHVVLEAASGSLLQALRLQDGFLAIRAGRVQTFQVARKLPAASKVRYPPPFALDSDALRTSALERARGFLGMDEGQVREALQQSGADDLPVAGEAIAERLITFCITGLCWHWPVADAHSRRLGLKQARDMTLARAPREVSNVDESSGNASPALKSDGKARDDVIAGKIQEKAISTAIHVGCRGSAARAAGAAAAMTVEGYALYKEIGRHRDQLDGKNISSDQFAEKVCESTVSSSGRAIGSLAGAAIGQASIPVPVVGAVIGGVAGAACGGFYANSLVRGAWRLSGGSAKGGDDIVRCVEHAPEPDHPALAREEPVAREPARSKDVGCSGESEPKLTEDLL